MYLDSIKFHKNWVRNNQWRDQVMGNCFCSYDLNEEFKHQIRREVCQTLPIFAKDEKGQPFCVLHYPSSEKILEFTDEFNKRIETNNLYFKYVWFPDDITFWDYIFEATLYFESAVFTKSVNFIDCELKKNVFFNGAKFLKSVNFGRVDIKGNINFSGCEISNLFHFSDVKFLGNAKFWMIQLYSRLLFRNVEFHKKVSLERVDFAGNVNFEGNDNNQIFIGDNVILDFQLAKPENPEKLLFYKTLLYPNWFVNVDASKFVFTDVTWKNVFEKTTSKNVKAELNSLKARNISNSKELLKIACRQLAENAENNNRFEEASNFRRMAFETEWLEISEKSNEWFNNILKSKEKIESDFGYKEVDLLAPLKKTLYIIRYFEFPHLFYRYLSYYGESWRWALLMLLLGVFLVDLLRNKSGI